jgi:hypothetical protein
MIRDTVWGAAVPRGGTYGSTRARSATVASRFVVQVLNAAASA